MIKYHQETDSFPLININIKNSILCLSSEFHLSIQNLFLAFQFILAVCSYFHLEKFSSSQLKYFQKLRILSIHFLRSLLNDSTVSLSKTSKLLLSWLLSPLHNLIYYQSESTWLMEAHIYRPGFNIDYFVKPKSIDILETCSICNIIN